MGIYIKSQKEIEKIRIAGKIVAQTIDYINQRLKPQMTLVEIEKLCDDFIRKQNAVPAFKGYRGFPASVCISLNEEVVHGIPDNRQIKSGDLVKIDIGVYKDGYYADAATTIPLGKINSQVQKLVSVTEQSLYIGISQAYAGNHIGDISAAIQKFVESNGFSVVRELTGHGVGIELHEEPMIPNFGNTGKGVELKPGMTLAIEPMVNMGTYEVITLENNWTVVTKDGLPSAHFEHTILITEEAPEILTAQNFRLTKNNSCCITNWQKIRI
ncbi:MAG: type I methionyl aminopeptidase [candidate division WOR-3 bacterium]|nr:type I methionyl aminopeptidase [candidate division WOR-3 bacterium]